jgi:hypothetical protein
MLLSTVIDETETVWVINARSSWQLPRPNELPNDLDEVEASDRAPEVGWVVRCRWAAEVEVVERRLVPIGADAPCPCHPQHTRWAPLDDAGPLEMREESTQA